MQEVADRWAPLTGFRLLLGYKELYVVILKLKLESQNSISNRTYLVDARFLFSASHFTPELTDSGSTSRAKAATATLLGKWPFR